MPELVSTTSLVILRWEEMGEDCWSLWQQERPDINTSLAPWPPEAGKKDMAP